MAADYEWFIVFNLFNITSLCCSLYFNTFLSLTKGKTSYGLGSRSMSISVLSKDDDVCNVVHRWNLHILKLWFLYTHSNETTEDSSRVGQVIRLLTMSVDSWIIVSCSLRPEPTVKESAKTLTSRNGSLIPPIVMWRLQNGSLLLQDHNISRGRQGLVEGLHKGRSGACKESIIEEVHSYKTDSRHSSNQSWEFLYSHNDRNNNKHLFRVTKLLGWFQPCLKHESSKLLGSAPGGEVIRGSPLESFYNYLLRSAYWAKFWTHKLLSRV